MTSRFRVLISLLLTAVAPLGCDDGTDQPLSEQEVLLAKTTAKPRPGSCTVNNGGCDRNATCTQLRKKVVSCACNDGYTGDGFTCASAGVQIGNFAVTMTGATSCTSGFGAVVTWTSVSESSLLRYVVQTSTEAAAYVDRDTKSPGGAGMGYESRFSLFDSGGKAVTFRLVAELADGTRQVLATSEVLFVPPNPC